MMEITDKTITLVGVVAIAGIACVTFVVGQIAVGSTCVGIIGGVLGTGGIITKKAETASTEDTASDLSTEDLVKEVDANTSLNDTSNSSVLPEAVNKVEDEVATATGLSDEDLQKIISGVAEVVNPSEPSTANAEPTVVTQ